MKRVLMVVMAIVLSGMFLACAQQRRPQAAVSKAKLQRIHFEFDRYDVMASSEGTLQGNAQWMQENPNTVVTVEGHCDERGSVEYNLALGERRAQAAKDYMINLGVADSRIVTLTYGKERPLCMDHNEECWWQNRRDEFLAR